MAQVKRHSGMFWETVVSILFVFVLGVMIPALILVVISWMVMRLNIILYPDGPFLWPVFAFVVSLVLTVPHISKHSIYMRCISSVSNRVVRNRTPRSDSDEVVSKINIKTFATTLVLGLAGVGLLVGLLKLTMKLTMKLAPFVVVWGLSDEMPPLRRAVEACVLLALLVVPMILWALKVLKSGDFRMMRERRPSGGI